MKLENELQLLQSDITTKTTPFYVWGFCNCQTLDVQIVEQPGPVWHIQTMGKGVTITKTDRYDLDSETGTYGSSKETKRTHIENKIGLKSFKAWIDTLKPYETPSYFDTKIFNY